MEQKRRTLINDSFQFMIRSNGHMKQVAVNAGQSHILHVLSPSRKEASTDSSYYVRPDVVRSLMEKSVHQTCDYNWTKTPEEVQNIRLSLMRQIELKCFYTRFWKVLIGAGKRDLEKIVQKRMFLTSSCWNLLSKKMLVKIRF